MNFGHLPKGYLKQPDFTAVARKKVVIVAHFADFNLSWVEHISQKLHEDYGELIEAGQFHGLHAKEERMFVDV